MTNKTLAETNMYLIRVEQVKSQITASGWDGMYCIVNKETDVVEGRAGTLADALGHMYSIQMGYDNITRQAKALASGESNDSAEQI